MIARTLWCAASAAGLWAACIGLAGCEGGTDEAGAGNSPQAAGPAGGGSGPPGQGPGGPGGDVRFSSPIRAIMVKLDRGPSALNKAIAKGLEADPPDWTTIQQQSSEYAQLVSTLGDLKPPQGSPESWAQLTTAFGESAAALDQAARAKDRDAARRASDQLSSSCMGCHRQHRRMPMGGGFGMPPGGGPPGGGPPGSRRFPGGGPPPGGPPPGGPPPSSPPPGPSAG